MSPTARKELGHEWTLADYGDLVVALVTVATLGGFGGYGLRDWQAERDAARLAAVPKRMEPAPAAALTQWSCSAQEFREYRHACVQRKRSDITQQINPITKGKL